MKDNEIRGRILRHYYDRRRQRWSLPTPAELEIDVTDQDILQVCDQLGEHNLLEWKGVKSNGIVARGMGKINAFGIDVVEGTRSPDIKVEFVESKTINITGSQNVVVGDGNVAHQSVRDLIAAIDGAEGSQAQKEEAKSLLRKFLEHPLVAAVAGGAVALLS
jgi:hypothetical protein